MSQENNKEIKNNKEVLAVIKHLKENGLGGIIYNTLRKECMNCDNCIEAMKIMDSKGYDDAHGILEDMKLREELGDHMEKCWRCTKLHKYGLYKLFLTAGILCTFSTGKKTVVVKKYGKKVHELREKGYNRGKIADMLKISLSSVDKCLKEWNEELEESFNKKRDTEPRVVNVNGKEKRFNFWVDFGEEYKRLKAEGLKDGEIAKMYGISAGTLSRHKQRYKWDK